jgi:hypothetical protein
VAAGNEEDAVDDDVDDSPAADGFVATVNNEYVKGILQSADLYILQHGQVSAAYNRTGNSTGIEGVHDYCHLFRILCAPYYKVIGNDTTKDSLVDTPLALWVFMMGHQTSLYMQPKGGKWYFFLDNFYTRHTIAESLQKFTDNKAHLIGTVKFINVDATNRCYLG